MTDAAPTQPAVLEPGVRDALAELLLTLADDEFVIGFSDSEWTGIAPILEEDVAMSSIAQDELGHAKAFYEILAGVLEDGRDADAIAYDREPEEFRHCRLVDRGRGDWAEAIVRRWLYDTADDVRLGALAEGSFAPLAELVAKIRREERYHLMHLDAWMARLAGAEAMPRDEVVSALAELATDALSVFTPPSGERVLVDGGVLATPMADLADRWRSDVNTRLGAWGLPSVPDGVPPADGRDHAQPSETFQWLWSEFTSVARLEDGVEW